MMIGMGYNWSNCSEIVYAMSRDDVIYASNQMGPEHIRRQCIDNILKCIKKIVIFIRHGVDYIC